MNRVAITGLLTIVLPSHTIRLCDGGFFVRGSDTYRDSDATYGTVQKVEGLSEGVGESVPALVMTLLPSSEAAAADLMQPSHQTAQITFELAEYDPDTGVITSVDTNFVGWWDQSNLVRSLRGRSLNVSVVSMLEKLFDGNAGNSLNATWHKSLWSGETGFDNATGLVVPIAWGVESPVRGAASGYSGGGVISRFGNAINAVY